MNNNDKIKESYKTATSYPDLAKKLSQIGVESYTVDTASGTILYRFKNGENILHEGNHNARTIAENFDSQKTIDAIRNNQQGKSDYPDFMNEIAAAGVRFYEATLSGDNKRVTYIGIGGFYEEAIP
ncbi:DUF1398 family protein [Flavobacterium capsici]|uniref:DUF1398 family protein n=1 Tax=Flavobacterium capsici TaxID=3075618 RepID=A0AA96F363_9FLAO|nr:MULTISPECIES: DUF1398 family protein [unclassified Flavobacterium]WNM18693.1 DUF1398 family protein [Flavobacterium sp. PMR2A8]WNM22744.1 DUF1398 family protein [Flavobacterium sp. PMTSA4]